jgi:hypothetical protein
MSERCKTGLRWEMTRQTARKKKANFMATPCYMEAMTDYQWQVVKEINDIRKAVKAVGVTVYATLHYLNIDPVPRHDELKAAITTVIVFQI